MPSSRSCRSSDDCIVKIKGVTTRPILFSQLMRSDGEGMLASIHFSPFGDAVGMLDRYMARSN